MMKFHIIHPVDVYQNRRSACRMLVCSPRTLTCSITAPPWLWTSALGRPVVPDEYSTHSGCSNGSGSKLKRALRSEATSAQAVASIGCCGSVEATYGTT